MRNKVLLKVKRYQQRGSECTVASCSSLANYYDPRLKYSDIRKIVDPEVAKVGMHTPDQALLLNTLGFGSVTVVTANTEIFDFSWQKHRLPWKINRLKKLKNYYSRSRQHSYSDVEEVEQYINFLETEGCNNGLMIDYNFPKYIKSSLRKGHPVIASINYTSYFKMPREHNDDWDDIKGVAEEHSFVIRGFDEEFIYIADSQGRKTEKYNGHYKIKWEHFLVNVGNGDLLLVE